MGNEIIESEDMEPWLSLADALVEVRSNTGRALINPKGWDAEPPKSIDEAYLIQGLVSRRLGPIKAWKVYSPDRGRVLGAPIYGSDCYLNPVFRFSQEKYLRSIGVELEFGYRLARDIDFSGQPYSEDDLEAVIDGIIPLIEIIDPRLDNFQSASMYWSLADNLHNGAMVIGDPKIDWRSVDLSNQDVELLVDGESRCRVSAWKLHSTPIELITNFVNELPLYSGGLKKGQIIITGSWTGLNWVDQGFSVTARFKGFSDLTFRF